MPLEEAAFDATLSFFTTRNFHDLEAALSEMVRVTKPGGTIVILDTFAVRGTPAWARPIHYLWLRGVVRGVGAVLGHYEEYDYMGRSIVRHLTVDEFSALLGRLGCRVELVERYGLGITCLVVARRSHPEA